MLEKVMVAQRPRLLCAVMVATLSGCATIQGDTTQSNAQVEYNKYGAEWIVTGSKFMPDSFWKGVLKRTQSSAWMVGTFDDTQTKKAYQLFVNTEGAGAGGFIATGASDATGTPLKVTRVENSFFKTTVIGTSYNPKEVVALHFDRDFLEQRRASGLDIQMKGYNNDAMTLAVPSQYLSDFLNKYDEALAANKSK